MDASRRSRFSNDVDPALPWPEYPRPQLRRAGWTNLNGPWELAITDLGTEPVAYDREILVPYPIGSELSGVPHTLLPSERAWMRRSFTYDPAPRDGARLRLHFGGVDHDCTVWCNGAEVGRHQGAHDPWFVDITDSLDPPGEQEIVLAIIDPTDEGHQPVGKQSLLPIFIWYPALAGVWQTVWLEEVPPTAIESVAATTDLAARVIRVDLTTSGASDGEPVEVQLFDDGHLLAAGNARTADDRATVDLALLELRPWTPDDPHLYDVVARCGSDRVESYVGAREVGVAVDDHGARRMTLNGEPIFHFGMLDQGWWPDGLYTAPTDEALAFDIEAQRAMGFNTIRKHVKVEPARWYHHADRLGMLVWQDMPSTRVDKIAMKAAIDELDGDLTQADFSTIAPAGDPAGFRAELDAMLRTLHPHPSIVVWVPFNEGWGQHDTAATLAHVAAADPSRLVDGPSGWVDGGEGHLRDHHVYGTEADFPGTDASRVVVYGEYGGYTLSVDGHRTDGTTYGYGDTADAAELAARYVEVTETLIALKGRGLAGAIYTQTTDVEGEINGLLTYDRAVQKIPNEILAPLHRRLIEG
ncbi:MAG: sugar-binding domain-containing protein [Actinomycetota bacterium]